MPPPASLLRRGFALVLDTLLFCLVFFPVTYLVKGVWLMTPEDHLWIIFDPICGVFLVIIILYYVLLEGSWGRTAGKWLLGMQIVNPDGSPISLRQSVIRNLGRMIDGLPVLNIVGIVSILRSPQNQRVGDKLAGTMVVRTKH